jgi:transcriptional regulator with XRE-family HTH domain
MGIFMMATAEKIKSLRRSNGMTQEDLAAKSGCGLATVQRAESGKRLTADTIASIAAAFNILASELTAEISVTSEPYLPLDAINSGRALVALLRDSSRIDFGFCELDNLNDAKEIELFYDFCNALVNIEGPFSPIALVTYELEARERIAAISIHGFQVGGANFEITAYEVDDEDGGIAMCFGQWDESVAALRIGRVTDEIARAHVLSSLGKWETVKGDAVVYPPSLASPLNPPKSLAPTAPRSGRS